MATENNPNSRLVYHTLGSRLDLISVYQYNEVIYGEEHAERYLDFLDAQIALLAQTPTIGRAVEQRPGVKVHLVKTTRRRTAHGHRIFYREIEDGIEIIRVLHTAMNWPDQI